MGMNGKYFMMLGLVMAAIVLSSCSSEKINNNSLEVHDIKEVQPTPVTVEADGSTAPSAEIGKEIPDQITGSAEDEVLSVSMLAELDANNNYTAKVTFRNKTIDSLELIYDCGLLISRERYKSDQENCLAVESMLLKKNQEETMMITIASDFFDTKNDAITVRYRHARTTTELEIQLQA